MHVEFLILHGLFLENVWLRGRILYTILVYTAIFLHLILNKILFVLYMTRVSDAVNKLFKLESNNYVFVYTPPKVGSTTLVSSLRVSLGNTYNIIHIHDEIMLGVLTGINDVSVNEIIGYLSSTGKTVYVIDVYRTPIERKMSEFFEKISPYHFNNSECNLNNYSTNRLSLRFNSLFPHIGNGDHYFERYNIGHPIPFDFENKYTVQRTNNIAYIKLRLCDSAVWANALTAVFATKIVMITDYQTENKGIGELYKRFKLEYKLPSNYLEEIKKCKYLQFYYSEAERNLYLNDWQQKITEPVLSYTADQYRFYMSICLENQYINDIQAEHYIDEGCRCRMCSIKRQEIFKRAQDGENITERIIHREMSEKRIQCKQNVANVVFVKRSNTKFAPNLFSIKLGK